MLLCSQVKLLNEPKVLESKYLPTIKGWGPLAPVMQAGFHSYILIQEYGVHITSAAAPGNIIRFIKEAAHGLGDLHSAGHLHW